MVPFLVEVGGDLVQQFLFLLFRHRFHFALGKGKVDERVSRYMVCAAFECGIHVRLDVFVSLVGEREDEVHGNCFEFHGA